MRRYSTILLSAIIAIMTALPGRAVEKSVNGNEILYTDIAKATSPAGTGVAFGLTVTAKPSKFKSIDLSIVQKSGKHTSQFTALMNAGKRKWLSETKVVLANGETLTFEGKFYHDNSNGLTMLNINAELYYVTLNGKVMASDSQTPQQTLSLLSSSDIRSITFNGAKIDFSGLSSATKISQTVSMANRDAGTNFLSYDARSAANERKSLADAIRRNSKRNKESQSTRQQTSQTSRSAQTTAKTTKTTAQTAKQTTTKASTKTQTTQRTSTARTPGRPALTRSKIRVAGTSVKVATPKTTHLSNFKKTLDSWEGCQAVAICNKGAIGVSTEGEIGVDGNAMGMINVLQDLQKRLSDEEEIIDLFITSDGAVGFLTDDGYMNGIFPIKLLENLRQQTEAEDKDIVSFTANNKSQWVTVWNQDGDIICYTDGSDPGLTKALKDAQDTMGDITNCFINEEGQAAICCENGVYLYKAPSIVKEKLETLDTVPTAVRFTPTGLYVIINPEEDMKLYFM